MRADHDRDVGEAGDDVACGDLLVPRAPFARRWQYRGVAE
jgi:hypothetical protein